MSNPASSSESEVTSQDSHHRPHTRWFVRHTADSESDLSVQTPSSVSTSEGLGQSQVGEARPQRASIEDSQSESEESEENFDFSAANGTISSSSDSVRYPLSPAIVVTAAASGDSVNHSSLAGTQIVNTPPSSTVAASSNVIATTNSISNSVSSTVVSTSGVTTVHSGSVNISTRDSTTNGSTGAVGGIGSVHSPTRRSLSSDASQLVVVSSSSSPIMSLGVQGPQQPSPLNMRLPNSLMPEAFSGEADVELWLKRFEKYALLQGWTAEQKCALLPLLFREQTQIWFDGLTEIEKNNYETLTAALLQRYKPHKSLKWVLLKQFQENKQKPTESVEDYFQSMKQKGQRLGKSTQDIMETIVAGLLTPISKFVMLRGPKTYEEALDLALTASVLQQDPSSDKVEVALATITDKIGSLQANFNSLQRQPPHRQGNQRGMPGNYPLSQAPGRRQNFQPRYGGNSGQSRNFPPTGPHRADERPPQQQSTSPFDRQRAPCLSCGGNHARQTCRMRNARCNFCSAVGHITACCKRRANNQ